MKNKFEDVMSKRTDEELKKIVSSPAGDYLPEAVKAAEQEIEKRQLIVERQSKYSDEQLSAILTSGNNYQEYEIQAAEIEAKKRKSNFGNEEEKVIKKMGKCECCGGTDKTKNYSFNYGVYRSWETGPSSVESRGANLVKVTPYKSQQRILGESSVCLCKSCISKRSAIYLCKNVLTALIVIPTLIYTVKSCNQDESDGLFFLIFFGGLLIAFLIRWFAGFLLLMYYKINDTEENGDWSDVVKFYQDKKFEEIKLNIKASGIWDGWTCMVFEREGEHSKERIN